MTVTNNNFYNFKYNFIEINKALFEWKTKLYRKDLDKLRFKGMFQPFSDVSKLTFKEIFYLNKIFRYRPIFIFLISSLLRLIYPMDLQ